MFGIIIAGWAIGMVGYILINKANKYNNMNYYDIKDRVIRYKRIKDEINANSKTLFK